MTSASAEPRAQSQDSQLEASLAGVEARLLALQAALERSDLPALEASAVELQRALAQAVAQFTQAARSGGSVPLELRKRLALASAKVAAQRESLACATAALDRAIDVLLPGLGGPRKLYSAAGAHDMRLTSGTLSA